MTDTQQALTEGFQANLDNRAFVLVVEGKGVSFPALVPPIPPDNSQFQIGQNEREFSRIRALRVDLPVPMPIVVGDYLLQDQTRHRVAEISDHPTDVGVTFVCETVPIA